MIPRLSISNYRLLFIIVSITLFVYFYKSPCNNQFPKVASFAEVNLSNTGLNTLITFDIDDTVIIAKDALAREYPSIFKVIALYHYPSLIKSKTFEHITSIIFDQAPRILIESNLPNIISNFKKHGCTVIGLTSMESGHWGVIKDMPQWRYEMLLSFGINFSDQFPDYIFNNLPKRRGTYPKLYKGIICTNQQPKGKVLGAFIDTQKLKPKQVISFDDDPKALCSIAQACKERKIKFNGYQYIRAKLITKTFITKRALLQLDAIYKQNKWLSDKEADNLLKLFPIADYH